MNITSSMAVKPFAMINPSIRPKAIHFGSTDPTIEPSPDTLEFDTIYASQLNSFGPRTPELYTSLRERLPVESRPLFDAVEKLGEKLQKSGFNVSRSVLPGLPEGTFMIQSFITNPGTPGTILLQSFTPVTKATLLQITKSIPECKLKEAGGFKWLEFKPDGPSGPKFKVQATQIQYT
jgi:hypothetical protein